MSVYLKTILFRVFVISICGVIGGATSIFYRSFAPDYYVYSYFTTLGISILIGILLGLVESNNEHRRFLTDLKNDDYQYKKLIDDLNKVFH